MANLSALFYLVFSAVTLSLMGLSKAQADLQTDPKVTQSRDPIAVQTKVVPTHSGVQVAPLTIAESVQQALDKNPDVLTARAAVDQTDANFHLAISKVFPTIGATAQANYVKNSPLLAPDVVFGGQPYNQYQAYLNVNQPLYQGGAILAGYGYSKKDREIKKYALYVQERTTTESVIEAFYSVLLNQRLKQILDDTYSLDLEITKIGERYFKIGRAQKIDLLQLQTETALLPAQIAQAQSNMETSAYSLAVLLRDLNTTQIRVTGELVAPDPKWVRSLLATKMKELPEVSEARTQVDQFEDTKQIDLATYYPSANIVGQIGRNAYSKTDLLDNNATSWTIGLQLNIPIFSGLASIYTKDSLVAQEHQLEFAEAKTSDTVSANQINTEKNLTVAETQLSTGEEAARYGRESLKEAQKDWKLATINYTQYQTSEQAYLTAETTLYNAKYNYIVSVAKYFEAVGVPIEKLVAELDRLSKVSTR